MFAQLAEVAKEIRGELIGIYWILLVPITILLVTMEVSKGKDQKIGVQEIVRRVVISILLLLSFDMVTHFIGSIGDGIMAKLDKYNDSWEVLKSFGPNYEGSDSWFDFKEFLVYAIAVCSYLVAYLGFFMAEALTHFVWLILYTCSPLMILCFVPEQTSNVTRALYKGLVKVVVWKVLWTILGALLLRLALTPQQTGMEDWLFSVVLNLCIGISMLFIPIATKSLINDGLEGASSAIAAVPAAATGAYLKAKAAKVAASGGRKLMGAGSFASKPLVNPFTSRASVMANKAKPKINKYKERYSQMGQSESYKNMQKFKANASDSSIRRTDYASKKDYFKAIDKQIRKEVKKSNRSMGSSQSSS